MTSQDFGALALQLLQSASIPGNALDMAVAFRAQATALAEGRQVLADAPAPEDEPGPA